MLPRSIANFKAFENAMTLDISMGGSTNTVLHLLAAAHEAEIDFTMDDIDRLSRRAPVLCKVAPRSPTSISRTSIAPAASWAFWASSTAPAPQPRRPHGPRRIARARALPPRHQAHVEQRDPRILRGRPGRRPDPGRLQPVGALPVARRRPREGRHPRRRARLHEGRRARGAQGQHRPRRLHREDRRRRRERPQIRGPGAHLREPGRRRAGHPRRQGRPPATSW